MRIQDGTEKALDVEGARISYRVIGPEDAGAPTLCLIASTGRGPEDFDHLATHLSQSGVRVVLPWPRGTGNSTGDLSVIDFHDLARDVAAVLAVETGQGGAFVGGHAYGCWIARVIAETYPDLVDGGIFFAAAAGSWPKSLSEAINLAMTPDAPETARLEALSQAFFAEGHDPRPWLEGWYPALARAQRDARKRTDQDSWWRSGTVPILDLVGSHDPFRPAEERDFYRHALGDRVTVKLLEGASHALPDELPEAAARAVVAWIAALDTP